MNLPLKDITPANQRVWPLTGGVHPEENKHQSTGVPISPAPIPEVLVLPLSQHAGSPADPVVNVGDKVLKGQIIAKATGFVSVPVHAPTSGTITAIEKHAIPHPSGMADTCIILNSDGEDRWGELTPVEDYSSIEPSELVEHIRQAGISGMGGAGFPTAVKLAPRSPVHTLILNGTECEPYITADDMLMRERAEKVLSGAEILMHLLKTERCLIGIEDNKPEAIQAVRKALAESNKQHTIKVVVFPTKYPSGGEKQLIQILTGQEVPSGKLPADLGIVVQNVGTAAAVHDAVLEGKPLISRVTTMTGEALSNPGNLEVLLGTSARDLLQAAGVNERQLSTLVMGGPMMGFTLDNLDVPVIKTSNCLIAGTQAEFPPAAPSQACIRCGMCAEACPSSLLPQQLYWHAKAENHEQLKHHNLFDCIECGACSFVCPSSIPLVQYYRASKGEIRSLEAKHAKAERSKVRYESRQARLEQEAAEKEAKRKANAERAAKLKAAKEQSSESAAPEASDPVKAAIARAKAKKAGGETAAKPALSAQQKELKIQLSLTNAQLKKTQRVLTQAEQSGEGDLEKLKSDVAMLQEQVDKLQKEYDAANAASEAPAKPAADDTKKLKIEHAMAKAALKKAERALAKALEEGNESTEALKDAVSEAKAKADKLGEQLANASAPAEKAAPAAGNADDEKKRKVELAMARATLKKAERALAKAEEEGSDSTDALKEAVAKAKAKLEKLEGETAKPAPVEKAAPAKANVDEEKKRKIEQAMAKAALKKAERALAKAQEEGFADLEALQKTVDDCQVKLDGLLSEPSQTTPVTEVKESPEPAQTAKVPLKDDLKKLKVANALAKAAVKKAQRALDTAEGDTAALEAALIEAQTKASETQKALEELTG